MTIELTREQSAALDAIKSFLKDDGKDAFVLRGSAGTGKTTLIARLVDVLDEMNLSCTLLAPTGRAARILSRKISQLCRGGGCESSTIHRAIYTLTRVEVNEEAETANDPGVRLIFPLKKEEPTFSLFVIDESSMVGDKENHGDFMQFGSGRLLRDLVTFARMKRPGRASEHLAKLLFVGDPVQLPPVGENSSPALSGEYLEREFQLQVDSFNLTTVMRQAQGSAILDHATELRDALFAERFNKFRLAPSGDEIEKRDVAGAVDLILQGLQEKESSVAVVRSNAMARDYNRNIRERRWGDADLPIQLGETLLVNKNSTTHSLTNGDLVKVTEVEPGATKVSVGLRGGHRVDLSFRAVTVVFRGGDGGATGTKCLVLENLLDSPDRELSPLEQRALLVDFRKRHPDLRTNSDEFRQTIRADPYFNALQVKYGYAMTCHKAQGGEWNTVVVDFGSNPGVRNAMFFRWAYTAITRATKRLVVVNPPDFHQYDIWRTPQPASAEVAREETVDPTADPDWNRLSFSAATAPLLPIHQQLRAVWTAQDISISGLQHLQYCERYTLGRGGKQAIVQYYYDKKHRLGRAVAVPGVASDSQLADDALTSLLALAGKKTQERPDEFIQEFLDRLDAALKASTIHRTGYRQMPYRLRVSFTDAYRNGEIDFTYDGTQTWTAAQEVGGPGGSQGIYERIQRLMAEQTEDDRS